MKSNKENMLQWIILGASVFGLYKLSSKSKTIKELSFKLKSFRIVKQPIPDYFKYGLPIEVEAYIINALPEPLKFRRFQGRFRLAEGSWNPMVFAPANGIGIAANGTSVLKFKIFVPIGTLSETIIGIVSGSIPSYVNVQGKVETNTLAINVNQNIDLDIF